MRRMFLNRVYVNGFAKLPVGKARYGVMLRDDGIVFDDGTTTRLSENAVLHDHHDRQGGRRHVVARIPARDGLAGSARRGHLGQRRMGGDGGRRAEQPRHPAAAFPGLDVSNEALPHMGCWRPSSKAGRSASCASAIPASSPTRSMSAQLPAKRLWTRLLEAGAPFGIKPYGVEALGALRVEKGHVAGPEIDGRTTLDDLGLGRMAGKRTGFVGDVLRRRPAFQAPDRQRLVGLECIEAGKRLRGGAILFLPDDKTRGHGRGRVTSVTFSPELGRYVGLALLAGDVAAEGSEVTAVYPMKAETVRARIVSPVFLDPKGERLHG